MTNLDTTSSELSIASSVTRPRALARNLLFVIRSYQQLTSNRVAPCRFFPSCSHYAYEAIEIHGAGRGTWLALRRLSRCRPLGPHGIDLVPEPKETRSSH